MDANDSFTIDSNIYVNNEEGNLDYKGIMSAFPNKEHTLRTKNLYIYSESGLTSISNLFGIFPNLTTLIIKNSNTKTAFDLKNIILLEKLESFLYEGSPHTKVFNYKSVFLLDTLKILSLKLYNEDCEKFNLSNLTNLTTLGLSGFLKIDFNKVLLSENKSLLKNLYVADTTASNLQSFISLNNFKSISLDSVVLPDLYNKELDLSSCTELLSLFLNKIHYGCESITGVSNFIMQLDIRRCLDFKAINFINRVYSSENKDIIILPDIKEMTVGEVDISAIRFNNISVFNITSKESTVLKLYQKEIDVKKVIAMFPDNKLCLVSPPNPLNFPDKLEEVFYFVISPQHVSSFSSV